MICPMCGSTINRDEDICPTCGHVFRQATENTSNPEQQPSGASGYNPADFGTSGPAFHGNVISKKDYLRLPENKPLRNGILSSAILCYISGVVTLIVALTGGISAILDVVILLGLALGIHLAQSRVCAVLLTVYGVLNMVLSLMAGTFGGWLILIAGILAIVHTFRLHKEWTAATSR